MKFLFPALLSAALTLPVASPARGQTLAPLQSASQIAVGQNHSCVLSEAGGVKCWGRNDVGQLGDGTNEDSRVPVQVAGLTSGITAISAGREHNCALTEAGGVKCWGTNFLGQLGDGTDRSRTGPVDVVGLDSGVASISAGSAHTCALKTDRELFCWGFNADGALGTGDRENSFVPVRVFGGQGVMAVSAGFANTCAITGSGAVSCWGVFDRVCNMFGCAFNSTAFPSTVSGLGTDIAQISAGEYFNCAVTTGGAVKCWGDNFDNQLGNLGTRDPDPFEIFDIEGLDSNVAQVDAGYDHACARLLNGTSRCWGDNAGGRLGDGTSTGAYPPVQVSGLDDVAQIEAGFGHTCVRTDGGGVQCWGFSSLGQLGDGEQPRRLEPTAVVGLGANIQDIAVGDFHSCALTDAGGVKCWGGNSDGQLGDGGTESRILPVDVTGLTSGVVGLAAGSRHTCAVTSGGATFCWGDNMGRQIGVDNATSSSVPAPVPTLDSGVAGIAAGVSHSCARTTAGRAKCFGTNLSRQLGGGFNFGFTSTPVDVINLPRGVTDITAGLSHSCAIVESAIECWGENDQGQIGDGTTEQTFGPVALASPTGVTDISAGSQHTCAVARGGAFCWGAPGSGRLGSGFGFTRETAPRQVDGLASGVSAISAGVAHTCAVRTTGAALCWGSNTFGQLGDGTFDDSIAATVVPGLESGIDQIRAGSSHTCALSTAGRVSCWGSDGSYQLGVGRRDTRLPAPVLDDPSFFRSGFEASEGAPSP